MLEHLKRCAESKIKVHGGDFYGRVEGRALIFCENTKITTSYWTTTNRRMLEPTKKKTPMSKDKGDAATKQQDRGDHYKIESYTRWVGNPQTGEQ